MEALRAFLAELRGLDVLLFRLGDAEVTALGLLKLVVLLAALFYLTGRVHRWMLSRVLARTELDAGVRATVAAIARYAFLLLGLLVIAQTSGINLTSFNVLAGAIGVGVGFGLQNIVSNFVSGLIIMFERSVKVGDYVVMAPIEGRVIEVGARRTTILTNDNIHFIVPNTRFITENVANLSYRAGGPVRVRVPVTVAAGMDRALARRLLAEAAAENPHVLETPPPQVRLAAFGGGGTTSLELLAWTTDQAGTREMLVSELNGAIGEKLSRHEIRLA